MNSSTYPPTSAPTTANKQATDHNTQLVTLGLSLATAPLLLGLIAARTLSHTLQDLGQMAEEVFRGDRLPLLTLPDPTAPSGDSGNGDRDNDSENAPSV